MADVQFIDTTIRDGSASLWAMEMRTGHMLPAMPDLDRAGFDQMEFFAPGSRLKKFVRHLGENPWHWIQQGTALNERTALRWHGGLASSRMSGQFSPAVADLLVEKAVDAGVRFTRAGSNWNNLEVNREEKARLDSLGMTPVLDIIYSVSPKHTDEYYLAKARETGSLEPFRICLKDVGGLLTPDRIRSLIPRMRQAAAEVASTHIDWEFHGHCNNGLGPLNAIEMAKAGVRYIHTAVPPLANGDSQPSVFNVAHNLRALGFDCEVDLDALEPVTEHFTAVARHEGFPIGQPNEYDEQLYRHQVPGGMISNFRHQLELARMSDRLPQILEEIPRVRADYGYPIMVTPLSQIVGTQAATNVVVGERYRQVTDESIHYAFGRHGGEEAVNGMDPQVRALILDRPRARELERWEPPNPSLAELRERYGRDVSDEDLILRAIVGNDAVDVVGSADESPPAVDDPRWLSQLLERVTERGRGRYVSISRPGFEVTMEN